MHFMMLLYHIWRGVSRLLLCLGAILIASFFSWYISFLPKQNQGEMGHLPTSWNQMLCKLQDLNWKISLPNCTTLSIPKLLFPSYILQIISIEIFITVSSQNEWQQGIRIECSIFKGKKCFPEQMKLHISHVTQCEGYWLNCSAEVSFQLDFAPSRSGQNESRTTWQSAAQQIGTNFQPA